MGFFWASGILSEPTLNSAKEKYLVVVCKVAYVSANNPGRVLLVDRNLNADSSLLIKQWHVVHLSIYSYISSQCLDIACVTAAYGYKHINISAPVPIYMDSNIIISISQSINQSIFIYIAPLIVQSHNILKYFEYFEIFLLPEPAVTVAEEKSPWEDKRTKPQKEKPELIWVTALP